MNKEKEQEIKELLCRHCDGISRADACDIKETCTVLRDAPGQIDEIYDRYRLPEQTQEDTIWNGKETHQIFNGQTDREAAKYLQDTFRTKTTTASLGYYLEIVNHIRSLLTPKQTPELLSDEEIFGITHSESGMGFGSYDRGSDPEVRPRVYKEIAQAQLDSMKEGK